MEKYDCGRNWQPTRSSNCFGCGQVGHFYEDCTNPDKVEYQKENHPYPQKKGPDVNWNLNLGASGETAGLFGTILNHLQRQERDQRACYTHQHRNPVEQRKQKPKRPQVELLLSLEADMPNSLMETQQ